jgi:hypothetical protein
MNFEQWHCSVLDFWRETQKGFDRKRQYSFKENLLQETELLPWYNSAYAKGY